MYASPADRSVPSFATVSSLAIDDGLPVERGMLASPFFWLGGAASIMVWTGIALAVLRWA